MIRRKGKAGFVGNTIYWIKGFFFPSYSATSVTIAAPDATFGVLSTISSAGQGLYSSMSSAGLSMLSLVENSKGLSGIIQSEGQGISSPLNNVGKSVESTI